CLTKVILSMTASGAWRNDSAKAAKPDSAKPGNEIISLIQPCSACRADASADSYSHEEQLSFHARFTPIAGQHRRFARFAAVIGAVAFGSWLFALNARKTLLSRGCYAFLPAAC